MAELSLVPKAVDSLLKLVETWRGRSSENARERKRRAEAIDAVLEAAIETKTYLRDLSDSGNPDRKTEGALAILWQRAGSSIRLYDRQMFEIAGVKALGWADPDEWKKSAVAPEKLKLDAIILQCRYLQDNE